MTRSWLAAILVLLACEDPDSVVAPPGGGAPGSDPGTNSGGSGFEQIPSLGDPGPAPNNDDIVTGTRLPSNVDELGCPEDRSDVIEVRVGTFGEEDTDLVFHDRTGRMIVSYRVPVGDMACAFVPESGGLITVGRNTFYSTSGPYPRGTSLSLGRFGGGGGGPPPPTDPRIEIRLPGPVPGAQEYRVYNVQNVVIPTTAEGAPDFSQPVTGTMHLSGFGADDLDTVLVAAMGDPVGSQAPQALSESGGQNTRELLAFALAEVPNQALIQMDIPAWTTEIDRARMLIPLPETAAQATIAVRLTGDLRSPLWWRSTGFQAVGLVQAITLGLPAPSGVFNRIFGESSVVLTRDPQENELHKYLATASYSDRFGSELDYGIASADLLPRISGLALEWVTDHRPALRWASDPQLSAAPSASLSADWIREDDARCRWSIRINSPLATATYPELPSSLDCVPDRDLELINAYVCLNGYTTLSSGASINSSSCAGWDSAGGSPLPETPPG